MQIQLCEFCLKSGMLCNKCQTKVESGEVSADYIEVAKLLLGMENQFPFLQKARLDNVLEAGGFLVLVVGKGDAAKFNADPKLTRDLGDQFNKRVLVIESGVKDRQFLEDLFIRHGHGPGRVSEKNGGHGGTALGRPDSGPSGQSNRYHHVRHVNHVGQTI